MPTVVPEQYTGHFDQPQVVGGFLLVAHQDRSALRQPAQRALHYPPPPPRRVALLCRAGLKLLLADPADVRHVLPIPHLLPGRLVVVGLLQAQVLQELPRSASGTLEHDGIESRGQSSPSSRTFAPATTTASAPPSASTSKERFTPFLALSVGLGAMRSSQNGPCPSHRPRPATPTSPLRASRTPPLGLPRSGR